MIGIGNVSDIDMNQWDEVWYITNYTPNRHIGAQHHPELAPCNADYVAYRQNKMSLNTLLDRYEVDLRTERTQSLKQLLDLSESGRWILCVCYCDKSTSCHRGVLFTVLEEMTEHVCLLS